MRTGGIVLCGGHSTRMGRSKAWLPIDGEPMLARVVRILSDVVSPVVVVAAEGQDLPELPDGVRAVRDERPDRGPLQGLAAGLRALEAEYAYVTACDVPLLRPAFVRAIVERIGPHAAAVPHTFGRPQPLATAYRIAATLPAVDEQLASHLVAVRLLFDRLDTRWIEESELRTVDPELESLRNANTPEQYAELVRIIDAASGSGRANP